METRGGIPPAVAEQEGCTAQRSLPVGSRGAPPGRRARGCGSAVREEGLFSLEINLLMGSAGSSLEDIRSEFLKPLIEGTFLRGYLLI